MFSRTGKKRKQKSNSEYYKTETFLVKENFTDFYTNIKLPTAFSNVIEKINNFRGRDCGKPSETNCKNKFAHSTNQFSLSIIIGTETFTAKGGFI